jgi:hypothetical protein
MEWSKVGAPYTKITPKTNTFEILHIAFENDRYVNIRPANGFGWQRSFHKFHKKICILGGKEILEYTWSLFYSCRVYAKYLNFLV